MHRSCDDPAGRCVLSRLEIGLRHVRSNCRQSVIAVSGLLNINKTMQDLSMVEPVRTSAALSLAFARASIGLSATTDLQPEESPRAEGLSARKYPEYEIILTSLLPRRPRSAWTSDPSASV